MNWNFKCVTGGKGQINETNFRPLCIGLYARAPTSTHTRKAKLFSGTSAQGKEPKALIKVDSINASFQPAKIGHLNGLQITYLKDYSTRNIFLYHDSGKVPTLPATITFMCVFVILDTCVCIVFLKGICVKKERERYVCVSVPII